MQNSKHKGNRGQKKSSQSRVMRIQREEEHQLIDRSESVQHEQYLNGGYTSEGGEDRGSLQNSKHRERHEQEMSRQDGTLRIQREGEDVTPVRDKVPAPKKRLFHIPEEEEKEIEVVPIDTDLEILLINSCKIEAGKVQTIVEEFIRDKKYTTIFCMTETKVEGHDFQPDGVKLFSKHRTRKMEKKGGGLALGYDEEADVKLEEIEVKHSDILAVEGSIHSQKFRLVLCYFDCSKLLTGKDFRRNRDLQKQVEKLMEVDIDTSLMVMGDFNGRLAKLEPAIRTDENGRMLETWVEKHSMHHLNALDTCSGTYTFNSKNGKSAIDHMLTNKTLYEKHIGMVIDEDRVMLEMSDHNLVRAWFHIGNKNYGKIPKKAPKMTTWISREQDRIDLL